MPDDDLFADTERLHLRRLTGEDLDDIHGLMSDPDVMRFSLDGPMSRKQVAGWLDGVLRSYDENGWGRYRVEEKQTGRFAGVCGFLLWPDVDGRREVEIGYRFLPDTWGKGYATEAASACRDVGFGEFGLTRLVSLIEAENVASWKVAEKVGMRLERDAEVHGISLRIYSVERTEAYSR